MKNLVQAAHGYTLWSTTGERGKGKEVPVVRTWAWDGETHPYFHYVSTPGVLR